MTHETSPSPYTSKLLLVLQKVIDCADVRWLEWRAVLKRRDAWLGWSLAAALDDRPAVRREGSHRDIGEGEHGRQGQQHSAAGLHHDVGASGMTDNLCVVPLHVLHVLHVWPVFHRFHWAVGIAACARIHHRDG